MSESYSNIESAKYDKWKCDEGKVCFIKKEIVSGAISGGHLHILQWVHTLHTQPQYDIILMNQNPIMGQNLMMEKENCYRAAHAGHLNVLQWLINIQEYELDEEIFNSEGNKIPCLELKNRIDSKMLS